jgi:hypothetical protein
VPPTPFRDNAVQYSAEALAPDQNIPHADMLAYPAHAFYNSRSGGKTLVVEEPHETQEPPY